MYVRIVRFEGASDDWDERIADIRQQMEEGRGTELGQYVKRGLMLVDRANDRAANVMFCETEEALRTVDAAMSAQQPPQGMGTRASVDMYEIALDTEDVWGTQA
jgi:hypothetical protein